MSPHKMFSWRIKKNIYRDTSLSGVIRQEIYFLFKNIQKYKIHFWWWWFFFVVLLLFHFSFSF